MARHADIPGQPARHIVKTRLTDADLAAFDAARGDVEASVYLRDLIRAQVGLTQPGAMTNPGQVQNSELASHRHRRGDKVESKTVKGVKHDRYHCAVSGCNHILET